MVLKRRWKISEWRLCTLRETFVKWVHSFVNTQAGIKCIEMIAVMECVESMLDDRRLDASFGRGGALGALEPARSSVEVRPREGVAAALGHALGAAGVRVGARRIANVVAHVVHVQLQRTAGGRRVGLHLGGGDAVLADGAVLAVLEVARAPVLLVPRERAAAGRVRARVAAVPGLLAGAVPMSLPT